MTRSEPTPTQEACKSDSDICLKLVEVDFLNRYEVLNGTFASNPDVLWVPRQPPGPGHISLSCFQMGPSMFQFDFCVFKATFCILREFLTTMHTDKQCQMSPFSSFSHTQYFNS